MRMIRLFGMLAGAAAAALAASPASAQTDVKFALDWKFEGPSAPYFLAIDEGYYKAEGLNVTIDSGPGSVAGIARVAAGRRAMGVGGAEPGGDRRLLRAAGLDPAGGGGRGRDAVPEPVGGGGVWALGARASDLDARLVVLDWNYANNDCHRYRAGQAFHQPGVGQRD